MNAGRRKMPLLVRYTLLPLKKNNRGSEEVSVKSQDVLEHCPLLLRCLSSQLTQQLLYCHLLRLGHYSPTLMTNLFSPCVYSLHNCHRKALSQDNSGTTGPPIQCFDLDINSHPIGCGQGSTIKKPDDFSAKIYF